MNKRDLPYVRYGPVTDRKIIRCMDWWRRWFRRWWHNWLVPRVWMAWTGESVIWCGKLERGIYRRWWRRPIYFDEFRAWVGPRLRRGYGEDGQ